MLLPNKELSAELTSIAGANLLRELGIWIDEVKFHTSTRFRNGEASIESLCGGFYRGDQVEHRGRAKDCLCQTDCMKIKTGMKLLVVELRLYCRLWPHLQIHDRLKR